MPTWFNDFADVPVMLTLMTAFFAGVTWVIKREVAQVKHEVFPNSGTSMRDAIDRMEERSIRIENKMDAHINWHMDHQERNA